MGRQHPPKINTEEPKKREYPSIGRMSPKETIDNKSSRKLDKNKQQELN